MHIEVMLCLSTDVDTNTIQTVEAGRQQVVNSDEAWRSETRRAEAGSGVLGEQRGRQLASPHQL